MGATSRFKAWAWNPWYNTSAMFYRSKPVMRPARLQREGRGVAPLAVSRACALRREGGWLLHTLVIIH